MVYKFSDIHITKFSHSILIFKGFIFFLFILGFNIYYNQKEDLIKDKYSQKNISEF